MVQLQKLTNQSNFFPRKVGWAKFTVLWWLAAPDQDNSWEIDKNPDGN